MKKFLFLASVLLASGVVSGARNLSSEALGTVKYAVQYKWGAINATVATASISLEKGERDDQAVYHSKALIQTTPIFKLFVGSDYVAETYLAQSNLAPVYFINPFTKNGFEGKFQYEYNADTQKIESTTVKGPQDVVKETFPLNGRTMDLLSLLHFIRFRDFSASDKPLHMHILMGGKSFAATLSLVKQDSEKFPGRDADHLLLKMTERGLMENGSGNEIDIWRSRGKDRRILGLEAPLSAGFMSVTISE
ncbi:MAG: DUF3108 domain-containing protein [Bacteroidales bacterium]|nr:DUF3108 domain-containing protein [Bacteroidales bacterium]